MSRSAVLVETYPQAYGGSQRVTHLLARRAREHGWDPLVILPAEGELTRRLADDGLAFEVLTTPPSLSKYGHATGGTRMIRATAALPGYWARLLRRLRQLRPRVLHVADPRGAVLAAVPARALRIPFVWHVHLTESGRFPTAALSRRAAAVVVPSRRALDVMPALAQARRLAEVPYPLTGRERRQEPIPPAPSPGLATIARLHPDKGLDTLVDALQIVREQVPQVTATVVGGPHPGIDGLQESLERRATEVGVRDCLRFTGLLDDPGTVLEHAQVYVHPARHEIRPLAILEAMALGMPIVATEVGGVPDLVTHDVSALLVPPDNAAALANAVLQLLDDEALRERLRRAAFAVAQGPEYSEGRFVERVTDIWEDVTRGS